MANARGTWRANDKIVKTRRIHQDAYRLTVLIRWINPAISRNPLLYRSCCRHVLWNIDVRRKSRNAYVVHTHGSSVLSLLFVYFSYREIPTVPLTRNVRRKLSARVPRPRAASVRKRELAFALLPLPSPTRACSVICWRMPASQLASCAV